MKRLLAVGFVGVVIAGCGGAVENTSSSGGSSGASSSSSSSSSSSGGSSSTSGGPIAEPPPSPPPPTPTGEPPPGGPPAAYKAWAQPGGLDHLFVAKADFQRDTCVMLHLTSPSTVSSPPFQAVATPSGWGLRTATWTSGAKECLVEGAPMGPGSEATSAKGSIQGAPAPGGVYPCTLAIDAAFLFAAGAETFKVAGLTVSGCM